MKNKRILLVLLGFALIGCGSNSNNNASTSKIEQSESVSEVTSNESSEDDSLVSEFKVETEIVDGYTTEVVDNETVYTFTKEGEYTVSGNLQGRLVFSSNFLTAAVLNLKGAYIESIHNAIEYQSEESKLEIHAKSGTKNTIKNEGDFTESCIISNNNVEFKGSGELNIVAHEKHAVDSSNITIGDGTTINVEATKDAFHAKKVVVEGGTVVVNGCDDGFQVEKNSKGSKGTFEMTAGDITIKNGASGIKAETSITISGGTFKVVDCEEAFVDGSADSSMSKNFTGGTVLVNGEEYTA